jgi:hypothetical protein
VLRQELLVNALESLEVVVVSEEEVSLVNDYTADLAQVHRPLRREVLMESAHASSDDVFVVVFTSLDVVVDCHVGELVDVLIHISNLVAQFTNMTED